MTTPTPATPDTPAPAPTDTAPATPTPSPTAPPWEREGTPFDASRAWSLIENLRADLAAVRGRTPAPETAPAAPDLAPSTDPGDLARQLADLRSQLAREQVARAHGLPDDLVPLLGDGDAEALTARATALLDWRDKTGKATRPPVFRRPVEALTGGADPTAPAEVTDPAALADAVRARRPYR